MNESTGCTFHHLVGSMKMSSFFTFHHLVGENKGKVLRHIVASVENTKYVEPFRSTIGLCMNVLECILFMLIDMSDAYECFAMHEGIHAFDM